MNNAIGKETMKSKTFLIDKTNFSSEKPPKLIPTLRVTRFGTWQLFETQQTQIVRKWRKKATQKNVPGEETKKCIAPNEVCMQTFANGRDEKYPVSRTGVLEISTFIASSVSFITRCETAVTRAWNGPRFVPSRNFKE